MPISRTVSTLMRLASLVLLLPLLAGCGKPGSDANRAASAVPSPVLLLAPEDLRRVESSQRASGPVVTGSLQPEKRADLRAEIGALVQQVLKENGQPVRAGELLVRLDDTAIRESLITVSEAVRAAGQAFEQAERQVQRLRTLQAQGMSSMQALEDAELRRNNAQSDLVAARAREATARQQLRRTEVRAPFDGVVSERRVSAGDTAAPGKELVKVIDPRSMRFEGLVSADRMHELRLGQPVSLRVNGYPQTAFSGSLRRIDAAANPTTRQLELIVDFADPAQVPRVAGLYAEGRVETGATPVLLLHEAALVRAGEAAFVWRVGAGKLQKVAVKLGERDPRSGEYPVLAGLAAGEQVLRSPGSTLVDGQAFEFATPAATAAAGSASARQ